MSSWFEEAQTNLSGSPLLHEKVSRRREESEEPKIKSEDKVQTFISVKAIKALIFLGQPK